MQLALIGLGRMGQNMAKRLMAHGHEIIGFDQSPEALKQSAQAHINTVSSINELLSRLESPRKAWIMVPHGEPTDRVITELGDIFQAGDFIIDGGNSHFESSIKHHADLKTKNINFVDVGVSGGVFGLERGYCLMVGGDKNSFDVLEPIFKSLAPGEQANSQTPNRTENFSSAHMGYHYCGKSGAGHYVKMIHNAIEYGMMQSYAEGFELLKNAAVEHLPPPQQYDFDVREIAELWRRGSVVGSWLLDLLSHALHQDPEFSNFSGQVSDSGEGRWALMEAIKQHTSTPSLAGSLFTRFSSRKENAFQLKTLSALRKEFGGHGEHQGKK